MPTRTVGRDDCGLRLLSIGEADFLPIETNLDAVDRWWWYSRTVSSAYFERDSLPYTANPQVTRDTPPMRRLRSSRRNEHRRVSSCHCDSNLVTPDVHFVDLSL